MPKPKPKYKPLDVRFVSFQTAQWDGSDGKRNFSILALGDDGRMYRYTVSLAGWEVLNHELLDE